MKIIAKYKIFESIYDKYDGDIIDKLCNINSQFDEIRDNLKKFEDLNIYSIYFDDETGDKFSNDFFKGWINLLGETPNL